MGLPKPIWHTCFISCANTHATSYTAQERFEKKLDTFPIFQGSFYLKQVKQYNSFMLYRRQNPTPDNTCDSPCSHHRWWWEPEPKWSNRLTLNTDQWPSCTTGDAARGLTLLTGTDFDDSLRPDQWDHTMTWTTRLPQTAPPTSPSQGTMAVAIPNGDLHVQYNVRKCNLHDHIACKAHSQKCYNC